MKKILTSLLLIATALVPFIARAQNAEPSANFVFFSPQMTRSHLKDYTEEEKKAIEKDLQVVRSVCFTEIRETSKEKRKPLYLATAGAPGSRKSTILERFLAEHPELSQSIYLDPDQRALKFMAHTYYSRSLSAFAIAQKESYVFCQKKAYDKWRGASNYITLTLLEEAFAQKRDIVHGSSSTGDHIHYFLTKVKEAGYEIALLLCSIEDSVRQKAIQCSNDEQKFYQATPEDAVSKGKFYPQKMSVYFSQADTLYIFWSDSLTTQERLAAVFKDGKLQVFDNDALVFFIKKYEKDRDQINKEGKELPSWNELVDLYRNRF